LALEVSQKGSHLGPTIEVRKNRITPKPSDSPPRAVASGALSMSRQNAAMSRAQMVIRFKWVSLKVNFADGPRGE
jgi:fructose 1,6-bisphosphatase